MTSSVTVIIPTYNGALFIREGLESLYAQTMRPREVIVVDDCSTDDSTQVVEEMAKSAPVAVRLIRLKKNSGSPARPMNVGIAAARGEFAAVLDQDDMFRSDRLESQVRVLAENPRVAVSACLCGVSQESPARRMMQWQTVPYERLLRECGAAPGAVLPGKEVLRTLLFRGNFLVGYPAFTFRLADWRAKGGVDQRLRIASDYELLCWLCTRGDMVIRPSADYVRREHDANMCNNQLRVALDMARVRARYLAGRPWLLEDPAESHTMREWFVGLTYRLRETGNHRGAWECNRLTARVWGWDRALFQMQWKLPLHWLRGRLTGAVPADGSGPRPLTRPKEVVSSEPTH
jgi:glycosyltransferase involved in cell wall biosynthesis